MKTQGNGQRVPQVDEFKHERKISKVCKRDLVIWGKEVKKGIGKLENHYLVELCIFVEEHLELQALTSKNCLENRDGVFQLEGDEALQ